MLKLKYGNTNTFFLPGNGGGLLMDTDYAGTLPAFYRELKRNHLEPNDISYVLASHYHPDHSGLIGQLTELGIKLLLIDAQKPFVHFSDLIFERDRLSFVPICEANATVISCEESREFLSRLGIDGELIATPSHSADGVSLILDDGSCFVGDLEPFEYLEAYEGNSLLKKDWERILAARPKRIYYAHRPEQTLD